MGREPKLRYPPFAKGGCVGSRTLRVRNLHRRGDGQSVHDTRVVLDDPTGPRTRGPGR